MPNVVNKLVVQELTNAFENAEGMLLVTFGGLTVAESEGLRNQLAEKNVRLRMVRNSLARRVFAERGLEFAGDVLLGNTAIAYGDVESAIVAAKVMTSTEVKKAKKVKIQAAMIEGDVLGPADALLLADMPDYDTLRGQLLGCISGPARGLASLMHALPSGLARVLQAHADDAEGQAASA